ncbi:MAG: glycosyltransferase family 2 protein, partial [Haloarculaceae archaeon]
MVPDTFGNPMWKLLGRLPPAARATLASIAGSWTSRVVAGVVAVGVVVFGFAQGSIYIVLQIPAVLGGASVAFLQAEFALLNFAGFLVLSALALGVQVARRDPPTDRPETGPDVAAIVPVYRDADTVHRSVKSLVSAAYDDLHVYVVCEPDDDASIARARELEGHHDGVTALVNENPGSKAGAVNYAADVTDTEYLAVFDADELVHPEFVPAALAELREADVVQGRTIPEPDGFVETAAYYESVILGELTDRLVSVVTGFRLAASH